MAAVSMRILCFIDVNDLDDDTIVATWESYTTYGSRLRSICSDYVLTPSRNAMLREEAVASHLSSVCTHVLALTAMVR